MQTVIFLEDDVPCFSFNAQDRAYLQAKIPQWQITHCHSEAEFLQALPEAEIALCWTLQQAWLERAVKLRWIATPAAGRDLLLALPPPHMRLTFGAFHGPIMAETVLGMMLSHVRGLRRADLLRPAHAWPQAELSPTLRLLRGAHVGILGFGHIGQTIGQYAKFVGARVTGIKRTPAARPAYFEARDQVVTSTHGVLRDVDYLVVVLPSAPSTNNIVNAALLAELPRGAVVINVGRGNAVDEMALLQSIRSGHLSMAFLDVFAQEPMRPDHPFLVEPNIHLLPHASCIAPEYMTYFVDELVGLASRRP